MTAITRPDALADLKARLRDVHALNRISAVLEWDQQTQMPEGAAESRARQISILSRLVHEMFTADSTRRLLEEAAQATANSEPTSDDAALVRVIQRDFAQSSKLPASFVEELAHLTATGHEIWAKARRENDFKSFAPTLARIMAMKRQQADYLGYSDHPYDALLDTYEPGMKTAEVQALFAQLRAELVPLATAIRERVDAVRDDVLHQNFDVDKQREFAEMVIRQYGFDFKRGRQDRAVHPFCTSFSCNDVRITTRYYSNWLNPALFGTLHEAGHGMYEQGSAENLDEYGLGGGVSLGVHESQSRLWENVIGRSRGFWTHFFPKLQGYFPEQLGKVPFDAFYRAINKVTPSLIRVEADEVTYNLHIMIRLELEIDLLTGALKVEDLPAAWNAKYQSYLGITPETDSLGCLQDIHWSSGLVGYFPTYSLGNILSCQLYEAAQRTYPEISAQIAAGQFDTLREWMRVNIYQHGRKFDPPALIHTATGQAMTITPYMRYLTTKYGEVYDLR
jgi:carboxypeptidase Taq